jgi:hypothetical protein
MHILINMYLMDALREARCVNAGKVTNHNIHCRTHTTYMCYLY